MIRNTSMDWLNVFSGNYKQVTSVLPGNVLFLTHENRCISYRAIWFSSLFRCRHGHSWDIIHAAGTDKPILIVLSSIFLELKNIYKIINVFFRSARELYTFLRFDSRFSYSVYKTDDGVYCCVCSSHRICFYYILYTLYGESPPHRSILTNQNTIEPYYTTGIPVLCIWVAENNSVDHRRPQNVCAYVQRSDGDLVMQYRYVLVSGLILRSIRSTFGSKLRRGTILLFSRDIIMNVLK